MKTVVIRISDDDYEELFKRENEERRGREPMGRLLVAVQRVVTEPEVARGVYVQGLERHCSGFGITTNQ